MRFRSRPGVELVLIIVLIGVMSMIGLAVLSMVSAQYKLSSRLAQNQKTIAIAEAGVNYYRWHLAHYTNDFQDGTGGPGPYVHDYEDADGNVVGRYELTITPPTSGNTITTIQSVGYLTSSPGVKKTIIVKVGIPSLTKFAVVANEDLRFGEGTITYGPIQSNGGIRFDGLAYGLVSSAKTCYDDPDHTGGKEFGVHTHAGTTDPLPNNSFCNASPPPSGVVPSRTDVFAGGRQFPVAPVDFAGITTNLATLKADAQSGGIYLPSSGGLGYHLTLRTDGKVDVRVVNSVIRCQYKSGNSWYDYGYCSNSYNTPCSQNSNCSGGASCILSSHTIGTASGSQGSVTTKTLPANGIIFASDSLWVDGQVNNARVTIVAAEDQLATGNSDIYITNDLKYTHFDGTDAIGLIAQNNILVGYFSENNLEIDGALIAQKGRISRPYYGSAFSSSTQSNQFRVYPTGSSMPNQSGESSCYQYRSRSSLTSTGSLATYARYGFAWVGNLYNCGGGVTNDSGYCDRNLNFDSNLTFGPPPYFPTSGEYTVVSYNQL